MTPFILKQNAREKGRIEELRKEEIDMVGGALMSVCRPTGPGSNWTICGPGQAFDHNG